MTAIDSQTAEPNVKRRRFRVGRRTLQVLGVLALGMASWIVRVHWKHGGFLTWTAEYDRASYSRIRRAIEADPRQEGGRPFDEVSRELSLDDVPWDDASIQSEPGMYRMYHFPGFALYIMLRRLPAEITLATSMPWRASPDTPTRLWLLHDYSFVRVDGLNQQERMRRYWKEVEDECERINAEMEQKQRTNPTPESTDR
jgi:hypothetical protein